MSAFSGIKTINLSCDEIPAAKKINNLQKKKLIVNLDGTLVSVFTTQPNVQHSVVNINCGDSKLTFYVSARKGLIRFLQTLNEYYEIQLFTSSVKKVKEFLISACTKIPMQT